MMELMLTLAVAGVLLGIGVPSFREFQKNGRLTGAANDSLMAVLAARNEALRRQEVVSFCPSADPAATNPTCVTSGATGFISFVDKNTSCQREALEDVVASASVHSLVRWQSNTTCISFGPNGFRNVVAGQPTTSHAIFCDDRGNALLGLGQLIEAAAAYQLATDIWRALNPPHAAIEPLAGLARVALAQGEIAAALAHCEEVLAFLESGGTLDGLSEPLRVMLTCYQVLRAASDPRAADVLETAYTTLQQQAAKITDEVMRRSFLEHVPYHREIVAAWATAQAGDVDRNSGRF